MVLRPLRGRRCHDASRACGASLLSHCNNIPPALIAMYFINAFVQAFPDTAMAVWLNVKIAMPQSEQSNFYSFIFLPTFLKPAFGWISDNFPVCGSHRRAYIIIASLGTSCMYFLQATVVTTSAAAFGVTFVRSFFSSFSELMLGAVLVSVASRNPSRSGAIQSVAFSARSIGSLSAYLIGLSLYSCSSTTTPAQAERIIGLTGFLPLLNIVLVCFLTSADDVVSVSKSNAQGDKADRGDDDHDAVDDAYALHCNIGTANDAIGGKYDAGTNSEAKAKVASTSSALQFIFEARLVLCLVLVEVVFIWAGLKSFVGTAYNANSWFVSYSTWWKVRQIILISSDSDDLSI